MTFVLVYADWCGHCQMYKPMWKKLTETPGRVANMAAVQETVFSKVPSISKAKIQGYPSVIKVHPDGAIESYNVNGETTNAIDSTKMRDINSMRAEISNNSPTSGVTAADEEVDIYTPVTTVRSNSRGTYETDTPGSLLTSEDRADPAGPQAGGGLSVAAAFAAAVQSVGPAALLLAAYNLMPKRRRATTYKSPKRNSRRGSTRRHRRL